MDRRIFIKKTCSACLGASVMGGVFSGCLATHYVSGIWQPTGIQVLKSEFAFLKEGTTTTRPYIIVKNEKMEYPICLYRFSQNDYAALLMKCTHQGTELQASGDHLHCSAHGSEFDNKGQVTQGPAETSLRRFNVTTNDDVLLIELK